MFFGGIMKKLAAAAMTLTLLILSCLSVLAKDVKRTDGEVLYHQDFSVSDSLWQCGIRLGTAGSSNTAVYYSGKDLVIHPYDSGRVHVLLPHIQRDASYTVEFSFRFTESQMENGYLRFLLTCRGEEPTNTTPVTIRVNGSVDDFSEPDASMAEAIASGETVNVRIPIRDGVLYEMYLTVNDVEYRLERKSVLMIEDDGMGFTVRNASVAIPEIFVMEGCEYAEKTGYFLTASYSDSNTPDYQPGSPGQPTSPDTFDMGYLLFLFVLSAAVSVTYAAVRCRRTL